MGKKWSFFLVWFLWISIASCFAFSLSSQEAPYSTTQHTKYSYGSYFIPVPVSKFTQRNLPCLLVQVEDKIFSMELDLGLRGDLSIESSYIDQIPSKKFINTTCMYGIRGKGYQTNLYSIPRIRIGDLSLIQPILQEQSEEFSRDSVIVRDGEVSSPHDPDEPGRVGWELFHNVNLLLDLKNSKIAFCDSIDTLEDQGYAIENFVKVPLLIERGLVEIEAQLAGETVRCMLDTGTTWNIRHTEIEAGKTIDQVALKPETILEYPSLKIGNKDFGSIEFLCFPIRLPIHIEAILGMEFFEGHIVFLDFAEKCIFFQKIPNG